MPTVANLADQHARTAPYAYLDERSKREVRRAILKALCVPGRQVSFASREMPVARGWGSGGLQLTLSCVGPRDVVKVIDQGDDGSFNAAAMRELIGSSSSARTTTRTVEATLIQSRHRIPEVPLRPDQLLILQLPHPEPLRRVVHDPRRAARLHEIGDYTAAWLDLYDDEACHGAPRSGADHPILVAGRALASPSPVPRHDVMRLSDRPHPILLGAGRLERIVAIPPHTEVRPLAFDDRPLRPEHAGAPCARCGSESSYRVERELGSGRWECSDTDACASRRERGGRVVAGVTGEDAS
ncbi:MAG: alpha-D-ribose 1-methylphosphonate 5-phosphate C-P-lyase PhnJ [Solirubrobacterales bacterium]